MVYYANDSERRLVTGLLTIGTASNQEIADVSGLGVRQIRKLRRNFEASGQAYLPSNTPYNSMRLLPWAVEVRISRISRISMWL